MSKILNARSPKGKASWPKLFRPDTRFNADGVYSTGLVVNPKDAGDFQEQIREIFVEEFGKTKLEKAHLPWKEDDDGNVVFTFKSKTKPKVYDSKGNPILEELPVGGGSTIKVGTGIRAWSAAGKMGVTMYLNAVQIIDLIEYSNSPFEAEEGGFVANEPTQVKQQEATVATEDSEEEDINF